MNSEVPHTSKWSYGRYNMELWRYNDNAILQIRLPASGFFCGRERQFALSKDQIILGDKLIMTCDLVIGRLVCESHAFRSPLLIAFRSTQRICHVRLLKTERHRDGAIHWGGTPPTPPRPQLARFPKGDSSGVWRADWASRRASTRAFSLGDTATSHDPKKITNGKCHRRMGMTNSPN